MHRHRVHGKCRARHSAAHGREQQHGRELESSATFHEVATVWGGHSCPPIVSHASAAILSHAVKPPNPRPPTARYLRTQLLSAPRRLLRVTRPEGARVFNLFIGKLRAILEAAKEYVYELCQPQLRRILSLGRFNPNPQSDKNQRRKRSPRACFMTCPLTSEIDFVSGISLGQTSTQFWA